VKRTYCAFKQQACYWYTR